MRWALCFFGARNNAFVILIAVFFWSQIECSNFFATFVRAKAKRQAECHTPSKRRTDGRTDGQTLRIEFGFHEWNLVHFSLNMWHLVEIILMSFLIINWTNFVCLLVDLGFSLPLKFLWSIAVRFPHRMDAADRHNGQRDKRTNEGTNGQRRVHLYVRPCFS